MDTTIFSSHNLTEVSGLPPDIPPIVKKELLQKFTVLVTEEHKRPMR